MATKELSFMSAEHRNPRSMGLTLRTASLSWLVSIVTLLIFVSVIIPQQKRTFLENLESKARGAAASLHAIAAGSAINEDYSTVVQHCLDMMDGDKSISYLVITKNDSGDSQICQQEKPRWHEEKLAGEWRPDNRKASSGIGVVPLFQRRVFHYSQPFDYSGIQWGWIHVGLSLESYDRNVAQVYQRTVLLAVVCIVFSLLASVAYAKRLVRPILHLRQVVQRVSDGDLSPRATVARGDELGSLAGSVNSMTEALRRRDQILQSVRFAAEQFLSTADWNLVLNTALANIGQAAVVSRAYVLENYRSADDVLVSGLRFEWTAPGIRSQMQNPKVLALRWAEFGLQTIAEPLFRGEVLKLRPSDMPATAHGLLSDATKSLIVVPIKVEGRWWGFMGFSDCQNEREWSTAEVDSFRAAANILGAAIERKQTQDALLEAKENLEVRVHRRTKELQEQIQVTERAMAKLAETQQSLMDMSRHAGMAEVATGVLHNVGNVLNSVNVSSTLISERLRNSRIPRIKKLSELLQSHAHDLPTFLTTDPAGQQIITYLGALADNLAQEQSSQLEELAGLRKNVEHIKDIVAMQQNYGRVSGFIELVSLDDVVEDALRLNSESLRRRSVTVQREFEPLPLMLVDKHRVLQILINLIRNAGHALEECDQAKRLLTLRVGPAGTERVRIEIQDNGAGIAPENLIRIFQHGFTTRHDGHGFGLHSGAIAAKEMGGSLHAHSDGPGQGATFTLELPLQTSTSAAASPAATAPDDSLREGNPG